MIIHTSQIKHCGFYFVKCFWKLSYHSSSYKRPVVSSLVLEYFTMNLYTPPLNLFLFGVLFSISHFSTLILQIPLLLVVKFRSRRIGAYPPSFCVAWSPIHDSLTWLSTRLSLIATCATTHHCWFTKTIFDDFHHIPSISVCNTWYLSLQFTCMLPMSCRIRKHELGYEKQ
jgi:hypothetical protein